jgi:sugar lactone lactonase YvrE
VAESKARLERVAEFDHQVTGVAVSETGRIFVNFPRWTEDSEISVAELVDDGLRPFPDAEWNSWRNAKKNEISPEDHFVCVQSVVVDRRGSLWVLDPAAPATEQQVKGGPKLVQIDLSSNRVVRVIPFGRDVAPEGSYLNDVRFHPDGKRAYLTDSGATGALVVLDLQSGEARRILDGHPSTQPEKDVVVSHHGKELRRPDGRGAEFSADSIEVTQTGVSDGYWMDASGRLYISAAEEDAVKRLLPDGRIETVVQDPRLRWPDSFAEGPDGTIYVTSSHIMDNMWFNPEAGPTTRTQLWRIVEG